MTAKRYARSIYTGPYILVSTSQPPLESTLVSLKGRCSVLCCSQSTAVQSPTSSLTTAYSITNTLMTHSSISLCEPTTHLLGCPFLRSVPLDVRQWYLQNGLQLNPDKSEALIVRTANQLRAVTSSVPSMSVAGVDLPVADDMKVLRVMLDRRLTFHKHVTTCLLYTSPSPRDRQKSRMPSSA